MAGFADYALGNTGGSMQAALSQLYPGGVPTGLANSAGLFPPQTGSPQPSGPVPMPPPQMPPGAMGVAPPGLGVPPGQPPGLGVPQGAPPGVGPNGIPGQPAAQGGLGQPALPGLARPPGPDYAMQLGLGRSF
jgi:hypothetical protein